MKKNQKASRTVFKKEIIAEFLPASPAGRPPRGKSRQNKVIILCQGMPSVPRKDEILELFSQKGFWVFFPRYRGTWESKGKFLKKSPHLDVLDIIDQLPKGFKDSWTGKTIKLSPDKIFIIGSSFGGPAAILASKDKRVDGTVCLAPVIDWKAQKGTKEPLGYMEKFTKEYFGRAYDFEQKDWQKLEKGNFYNPISEAGKIEGKKIHIIHAKDDEVVSYKPAVEFSRLIGCKLTLLAKGEHLGVAFLMENNKILRKTLEFLK